VLRVVGLIEDVNCWVGMRHDCEIRKVGGRFEVVGCIVDDA